MKLISLKLFFGLAIVAGCTGLLTGTSQPVTGQTNSALTTQQADELKNLELLQQQILQLYEQGKYDEAIPLVQQVLTVQERILGTNHPDVATTVYNLGRLYMTQRRYDDAKVLYQRAYTILEQTLGSDHPHITFSLNDLALLDQTQGRYNQAETQFQQALTIRENAFGKDHPQVALIVNNLALLYNIQGRYQDAEPLFQRAIKIYETAWGSDHPHLATSLGNLATLYQAQARYPQAETLFQRVITIQENTFSSDHGTVAASLNRLATLYSQQGRYTEAEDVLQRALAIQENIYPTDHPDISSILHNLAELYRLQGRYDDAQPLFERALAILQETLGKDHANVAYSLAGLALLYQDQGRYKEAEPLLHQALDIRQTALRADHPDIANSLSNLAGVYYYQGRYDEAKPLFQQALTLSKNAFGKDHPHVAIHLNGLAAFYYSRGQYDHAEPLYQQALEIRQTALGNKHPDVASSLNNLALLYYSQGRYNEAERSFQQALEISKTVLGEEHYSVALSLHGLATLYQSQKRYDAAKTLFQQALEIRENALGKEHPRVAVSLNNLATLYNSQRQYDRAEPLLKRSLAIAQKTLGTDHALVATNLNNLATLYENQGRGDEAESLWQQALEIYQNALGIEHPRVALNFNNLSTFYNAKGDIDKAIEFLQQGLEIEEKNINILLATGSEQQKQDSMNMIAASSDGVISLHIQDAPHHPEAARLALTTILRRKGRVLDVIANDIKLLQDHLTPENQTFLTELQAVRTELAHLIHQKTDEPQSQQQQQKIVTLQKKANRLEAELSRRSAEFKTRTEPVTVEAIQPLIPTDAALIEFILYRPYDAKRDHYSLPHYVAYILTTTGEPKWVDLGEAEPIHQAINSGLLNHLRDVLAAERNKTEAVKQSARSVDQLLMEPIRKKLKNINHFIISPDAELNKIPFAALVDETGQYLIEKYQITYLTTGRDLLRLQNQFSARQSPVLFANPNYSQNINSPIMVAKSRGNSAIDNEVKNDFAALPYTAEEASGIASLLPNVTILTENQATENAVKQLSSPQILHLATHGFFLENQDLNTPEPLQNIDFIPNNPLLRSGLVFAGVNLRNSGTEDGILTSLEAANLQLRGTKLVVLSACGTGLGDVENGEGVYGLRRAFTLAGAESQLMSLWRVDDRGTKELMIQYYQRLTENQGRSAALRQTQLELLKESPYQHPYYWATFIPVGDWTAIQE